MTATPNLVNSAMDHHRQGRIAEAEAGYRSVLVRDPNNPDALHLLGVIVAQAGDPRQGALLIEQSLRARPSSFEAHFNLANVYATQLLFPDAERHFRAAFQLRSNNADASNGVGGCLLRTGNYGEAETWLSKALKIDSRCASALVNLGTLMDATGRFTETIGYYDRALALEPDHGEALGNKALALLARGRFKEGWPAYACRFKTAPAFHGRFPFPYWRGENISGRKILVWTEQGLGDEILAVSMIPDLSRLGARIVLICSPRLRVLFARSFPGIDIISTGGQITNAGAMAGIDFQASVSHLGEYLRPNFGAFPERTAYLKPDPAVAGSFREKYKVAAQGRSVVGISWRSAARDGGLEKTIALPLWKNILRTPGLFFVNFQYGDTRDEVAEAEQTLGVKIFSDPEVDQMGSIDLVATQAAALDLVICVSNTGAHVAGAVGTRTWTLVPASTGRLWYWFLERTDSPWYPSVRLFRQRSHDWAPAFTEVQAAIRPHLLGETTI